VVASDGSHSGTGTLSVTIEDDAPRVVPTSASVSSVDTNVMLVLDTSGSMNDTLPGSSITRLQMAVQAMKDLLDRYDAQGDVAVRLVTFSGEGCVQGDRWTSVADARALLDSVKAGGYTNYDDALADAMSAFDDPGRLSGAQNVSYFLSDGDPTASSGGTSALSSSWWATWCGYKTDNDADKGIQAGEEAEWTAFLDANGITSHAVAVGADITQPEALNPIAYDGRSHTNTSATVVRDYADLSEALQQVAQGQASGRLWAVDGGMGADGGHVQSFEVGGVTYTYDPEANSGHGEVVASNGQSVSYDPSTRTMSFDTAAGGQFFVDLDDGGYAYRAPTQAGTGFAETFTFTVVDGDGDTVTASASVQVGSAVTDDGGWCGVGWPDGSCQVVDPVVCFDGFNLFSHHDRDHHTDGDDVIDGGGGHDQLWGGDGADVFQWHLSDAGDAGDPNVDHIGDFDAGDCGDTLDLRDLLGGSGHSGPADLTHFLGVDTQSDPGSTVLHVSTSGGFTDGQYCADAEDQRIVLDGVNLRDALGLGGDTSDQQLLQELLNRDKIDPGC
jgi:hypothetical protein